MDLAPKERRRPTGSLPRRRRSWGRREAGYTDTLSVYGKMDDVNNAAGAKVSSCLAFHVMRSRGSISGNNQVINAR